MVYWKSRKIVPVPRLVSQILIFENLNLSLLLLLLCIRNLPLLQMSVEFVGHDYIVKLWKYISTSALINPVGGLLRQFKHHGLLAVNKMKKGFY